MTNWYEGQKVIYRADPKSNSTQEGAVVKVGRTLVHVKIWEGHKPVTFYKDTGTQSGEVYGWAASITTPELEAERDRRQAAVDALFVAGIVPAGYGKFPQTTETLEQIVELLEKSGGNK